MAVPFSNSLGRPVRFFKRSRSNLFFLQDVIHSYLLIEKQSELSTSKLSAMDSEILIAKLKQPISYTEFWNSKNQRPPGPFRALFASYIDLSAFSIKPSNSKLSSLNRA